METLAWPNVAFWILAFSASLFYGWKATDIFNVFPFKPSWAWTLHQRWLNFAGSFVGWIALWFLGQKIIPCFSEICLYEIGLKDVSIFFLAFIGVTGFLPVTIVGLVDSIRELAAKLAGLLK